MMNSALDITSSLAFGLPGGQEWIVLLVLGLLIFGRRLPEVGRSLGKGIVEFKKGIRGIEDEIEEASTTPAAARPSLEQPEVTGDPIPRDAAVQTPVESRPEV